MKFIYLTCLLLFVSIAFSFADNIELGNTEPFYFDAVVSKGNEKDSARVDVFVLVPYESLMFNNNNNKVYGAKYSLVVSVFDDKGRKVYTTSREKTLVTKDYFQAQGRDGDFDANQMLINLAAGNYNIKLVLRDEISKNEKEKSRNLTVLNFGEYPFVLSGIMLVSTIEENDGKFKATPHVSDDIGALTDGFFAFFEVYNKKELTSADFYYNITDSEGKIITQSEAITKDLNGENTQLYIKIPRQNNMVTAKYTLEIIAKQAEDTLAVARRSIKFSQTIGGMVLNDINESIRQLRYVASSEEREMMEEADDDAAKQKLFKEFWQKLDPTPATERNEAFQEYYSRIAFANRKFKSHREGWLSDMGMVYVIFGPPRSAERGSRYGDSSIYEIWTYGSNRQYVFRDNSGMNDFRLVSPMGITEKYKYED